MNSYKSIRNELCPGLWLNKEEPLKEATLTTVSVNDITTNNAQSGDNITSDGGGDFTSRGVVWGKSPSPTAEQNSDLFLN